MENSINTPVASVIVPTYNRKKLLNYTLKSLTHQSLDPKSFETIVVDDGSSDNTQEIIALYKDRLNIQYFYQEDKGYRLSTARNLGLRAATADICILIDAGICLPSWGISEHIHTHQGSPDPVAVIGYLYGLINSETLNSGLANLIDMNNLDESLKEIKKNHVYSDMREEVMNTYNNSLRGLPAPWIFFWGGNVSFDKTIFTRDEFYFNEIFDMNWGCEDVEFGYRLHKKGVEIILNPNAEAIHYPHPKYEDFEHARLINVEKFNNMYKSPETKLLFDMSINDMDNIFLNDYLRSPVKQIKV